MKCINYLAMAAMLTLSVGAKAQETTDSIDQCQFVVVYDYKCNTQDKLGNAVTDSMQWAVQVGKRVTKCQEYHRSMTEDLGERMNKEHQLGEFHARPFNVPTFYMNHPEGEMRVFDKIIPQYYRITGKLEQIDWKISDDTLTIGGYLCHKAVGDYAGRTWNVWYAEPIPSSAGPWKLRGLPGMILQAEDSEGVHSFEFCGLLNIKAAIKYKENKDQIAITVDKFVKQRNKIMCNKRYVQNPRYYIPESVFERTVEMWGGGPEPPAEEKQTTLRWDMVIPKTANVYQPLELE